MVIARGDLWWADLPEPTGSEPGYYRPVLIVQDIDETSRGGRTVVVVPLTSNLQRIGARTVVLLPAASTGLSKDSVAVAHAVLTIDLQQLKSFIQQLRSAEMELIETALMATLGLLP